MVNVVHVKLRVMACSDLTLCYSGNVDILGVVQLEVKNTVSLHLRSDALAEDMDALLAAGRLISHLFSRVVGQPPASPGQTLQSPGANTPSHIWSLPPTLVTRVSDAISAIRDAQVHCQVSFKSPRVVSVARFIADCFDHSQSGGDPS